MRYIVNIPANAPMRKKNRVFSFGFIDEDLCAKIMKTSIIKEEKTNFKKKLCLA